MRHALERGQMDTNSLQVDQERGEMQALRRLCDRVAIVTGSGQGLGQAICHRLAAEGARIVAADLNPDSAADTAQAVYSATQQATLAVQVDVTQEDQVAALIAQTEHHFGRIDILVANAGIVGSAAITEFDAARWRDIVAVNLTGYFLCAKHVAPVMRRQRQGVIVQINSISGKRGSMRNSAYCASKAAGIGLTQSLALELADCGVRVNAICPGHLLDSPLWVKTLYRQYAQRYGLSEDEVRQKYLDAIPLKRGCTYQDVCSAVLFLASDRASFITGQAINVNGGEEMRW